MFQIALYTKSFCISNKQNEIPHNLKLFIISVFISIIPNVSDFFCSAARAALYCLPCLRSSWPRSRLQVWAWECRLTVTELCRVLANRRGYCGHVTRSPPIRAHLASWVTTRPTPRWRSTSRVRYWPRSRLQPATAGDVILERSTRHRDISQCPW